MEISGCGTALVTPFRADGSVDESALVALVNWQVESGINFLIPCGTTGETPTLCESEWLRILQLVVETVAGRIPVIAGCTHNSTHEAVRRVQLLNRMEGLSGILTANPYYNKPMQEGQYQHFRAIAEATHLSVMLYNIPGRTAVNLLPETVVRLAELGNVVAIKESSGNLQQITELIHMAPTNFHVLAGDDNIALAVVSVGGAGVISVASNEIPVQMSQMVAAALKGDWDTARQLHRHCYPLMVANFWETNPGPVKCVLSMMGRIQENYRLPMVPIQSAAREKLKSLAKEMGLLPPASATADAPKK